MTEQIDRLREGLVGKYEVDRAVGQGGMATVYLARDVHNDRKVAIKVLKPELAASIGHERFLREIKLASQLQHPNILGLHESGDVDGLVWYSMPFIEGESLRDRIDKEKQLPIEDSIRIVREAGEALGYAHGHGIVHRDIKPENILLMNGHALVADFGIAKAVEAAGAQKLTETGMAVGTPHYMSPEQALGGSIDGRSDQYALACVLYECLVGQSPFDGPTPMAILARHAMEQVPSMQVVRGAIPDAVEDVVFRAMEKTPADRFPTMKEFCEALEDAEADVHVARTAARRATQGHRATGAAGPRATAGRVTAATRRATTPIEMEARPAGGKRTAMIGGAVATVLVLAGLGVWKLKGGGGGGGAAEATPANGLDPHRIAVTYLMARNANDSLAYLADGITEALIHELSDAKALQVVSRNGVAQFRGKLVPADSVGRALKAGTIVGGTIDQAGDKLRVTIDITNSATGAELGSKTIEKPRAEIFDLQEELAREVAVFLRKRLGEEVQVAQGRAGTRNAKAWEVFQRGMQTSRDADTLAMADDSLGSAQKFAAADSLFAAAAGMDNQWAAPSTMRGWLQYRLMRLYPSAPGSFHAAHIATGLEYAKQALDAQPQDADALELRGTLRYWKWLNNLAPKREDAESLFAQAERDLRASVAANEAQATAWATMSHLLMNKPATAEAKLSAMRANEADPYLTNANAILFRLFTASYTLDDALEAERWCKEGHERFPSDFRLTDCQLWLGGMRGAKPDIPRLWAVLDSAVKLSPPGVRELNKKKGEMRVAVALARAGLADSAKRVAERARGSTDIDSARELEQLEALVYMTLNDKDEAFRHLSAYIASNPQLRGGSQRDESWEFKDLQSDPRWATLMGK